MATGARQPRRRTTRGFTLVEILIVVVILGILASIVIPQFSSASHEARENTLKDDLRYLRTQIEVYTAQHRDAAPGYPAGNRAGEPTVELFLEQLTRYTDQFGHSSPTASPDYPFGPYLSKMPVNPLNGLDTILLVTGESMPAADGSTGWIYNPQTRRIIANLTGSDADGTAYSSY